MTSRLLVSLAQRLKEGGTATTCNVDPGSLFYCCIHCQSFWMWSHSQMTEMGNFCKRWMCVYLFWQLSITSGSQSLSYVNHTSSLMETSCTVLPNQAECYIKKRCQGKRVLMCVNACFLQYILTSHLLCACVFLCLALTSVT